ncbi:MAG: murein biosynthesis integral membrane protein MurJ [Candidatus Hydrogenedentota bacterium]|nr:MAG: murein biosynthesis integral membrane protein MurJ [Candidatus Hydrogenedentota bacterium]
MNKVLRHTTTFSFLTLLSRITGLLRVMAFAAILGSGRFDDAYQLANTIPNILYEFIIGGVLSSILIPLLVREQQRHGKSSPEAWRTANLLLGYVGGILAIVSAAAVALAPQIVGLLTALGKSSHAAASRELSVYFFRFFAPQMFFYGLNAVFMAILNSHKIFGITAAAPILNNVVVITTLLLYRMGWVGVTGLAVGTTAGIAAMALVQVPWLLKIRMPIRPRFSLRDPLLGSVVTLSLPVLVVAAANLVATAVRTNLLYSVGGGYTTYTFCFQLVMMPYGIIAVSIATVLYPTLAEHAAKDDRAQFLETMSRGVRWTTLALLPISVGICLLAEPITRVLFERGQFHYADSLFTSRFLALYALSIVPYALVVFATRIFYALKDTRTPAWINIAGVVLNIALNFLFMRWFGIPGIALSSAVTYVFTLALSLNALRKRLEWTLLPDLLLYCGRMLGASLAMAVVVWPLLTLTQPKIAILEQGREFPAHVSARYDAGGSLVLSEQREFQRFWSLLRQEDSPTPTVDFSKNRVVVVFAPRGTCHAWLRLAHVTRKEGDSTPALLVEVYRRPIPAGTPPPAEPAFLVAQMAGTFDSANVRFVIYDDRPHVRWLRALQLPELARLTAISVVGALVYLVACKLFGIREIGALFQSFTRLTQKLKGQRVGD